MYFVHAACDYVQYNSASVLFESSLSSPDLAIIAVFIPRFYLLWSRCCCERLTMGRAIVVCLRLLEAVLALGTLALSAYGAYSQCADPRARTLG